MLLKIDPIIGVQGLVISGEFDKEPSKPPNPAAAIDEVALFIKAIEDLKALNSLSRTIVYVRLELTHVGKELFTPDELAILTEVLLDETKPTDAEMNKFLDPEDYFCPPYFECPKEVSTRFVEAFGRLFTYKLLVRVEAEFKKHHREGTFRNCFQIISFNLLQKFVEIATAGTPD